jgi:hypothetical protein
MLRHAIYAQIAERMEYPDLKAPASPLFEPRIFRIINAFVAQTAELVKTSSRNILYNPYLISVFENKIYFMGYNQTIYTLNKRGAKIREFKINYDGLILNFKMKKNTIEFKVQNGCLIYDIKTKKITEYMIGKLAMYGIMMTLNSEFHILTHHESIIVNKDSDIYIGHYMVVARDIDILYDLLHFMQFIIYDLNLKLVTTLTHSGGLIRDIITTKNNLYICERAGTVIIYDITNHLTNHIINLNQCHVCVDNDIMYTLKDKTVDVYEWF